MVFVNSTHHGAYQSQDLCLLLFFCFLNFVGARFSTQLAAVFSAAAQCPSSLLQAFAQTSLCFCNAPEMLLVGASGGRDFQGAGRPRPGCRRAESLQPERRVAFSMSK